jgi:MazG family protein
MSSPPTSSRDITALIEIMRRLREPGSGCPWDLEQTFATIAPYTIEEAYEVADAISRGDMGDLKEELGDLLLQVVYHAQMANEQGSFDFGDVVQAITAKMIRRHPHVFGDDAARSAGAAKGFWERAKAAEKAELGKSEAVGLLDAVPLALPALARAVKLQGKAAEVGFDWPSLKPVVDKLKEELGELEAALACKDLHERSRAHIEEEFGDMLFVLANVARHLRLDPEAALRSANAKFERRFRYIERQLAAKGKRPTDSSLEEMDALWNQAKREEGKT